MAASGKNLRNAGKILSHIGKSAMNFYRNWVTGLGRTVFYMPISIASFVALTLFYGCKCVNVYNIFIVFQ